MDAKDTLYAGAVKQDQKEQALSPDLQASNFSLQCKYKTTHNSKR